MFLVEEVSFPQIPVPTVTAPLLSFAPPAPLSALESEV